MTKPLIEISGLYKIFGPKPKTVIERVKQGQSKDQILADTGHTVGLKDINLQINKGEIFVIMGLSGSGKSTMIRHFNRLIDPTMGQILVEGVDVMQLSPKELEEFRRRFYLKPLANAECGIDSNVTPISKAEDTFLTQAVK